MSCFWKCIYVSVGLMRRQLMTSGERSIFFLLPMINTHTHIHAHAFRNAQKHTHERQACLETTPSALMPASFCPPLRCPLHSFTEHLFPLTNRFLQRNIVPATAAGYPIYLPVSKWTSVLCLPPMFPPSLIAIIHSSVFSQQHYVCSLT